MKSLNDSRDRVLAAWEAGFLTDQQVDEWSAEQLMAIEGPAAPDWLLELAEKGPFVYRNSPDFDWPESLDFLTRFAIRAVELELSRDDQVGQFARWAARHCIAEDLDAPEVKLSYELDHLVNDCERRDLAVAQVRRDLPALLAKSRNTAAQAMDFS